MTDDATVGQARRAPITGATGPNRIVISRRSLEWGVTAAAGLSLFYVFVVGFASGSVDHLVDQSRRDWYFLALIIGGFGTQVALVVELRRRRRLSRSALAAGGGSTGASGIGMVACCAHHIADLLPLLGATGAAAFLLDLRIPFMVGGIAVNALGIAASIRELRRVGAGRPDAATAAAEETSCVAA